MENHIERLIKVDLRPSEKWAMALLLHLSEPDGCINISKKELKYMHGSDSAGLGRVLSALEKRGFIKKDRDGDGQGVCDTYTPII